jgi:hypothetical protein
MQSTISLMRLTALSALVVAPLSLRAQEDTDTDWNHFGLNLRAGFNIRAKFAEPATVVFPPGPGAGPAVNHQYNDGYVNVDSSGNQGGSTWNWGYHNASQISGNNLLLHATGTEGASGNSTDDPNLGIDFNYIRDIGHEKWGQWGIKVAFGYTHVQVHDQNPLGGNLETITDAYPLNGIVPPQAPYSGSAGGPGPVIGSQPTSRSTSVVPDGAVVTGNHDINAGLYDLRLGPAFNIPLGKRFSLQAGGGLALGVVSSHFTFNDITPVSASGGDNRTGFVPGAYAELGFAYRISRPVSVFTGAQFQYLENFQQNAGGRSAQLDFGQTVFYELGVEWHF